MYSQLGMAPLSLSSIRKNVLLRSRINQ